MIKWQFGMENHNLMSKCYESEEIMLFLIVANEEKCVKNVNLHECRKTWRWRDMNEVSIYIYSYRCVPTFHKVWGPTEHIGHRSPTHTSTHAKTQTQEDEGITHDIHTYSHHTVHSYRYTGLRRSRFKNKIKIRLRIDFTIKESRSTENNEKTEEAQ